MSDAQEPQSVRHMPRNGVINWTQPGIVEKLRELAENGLSASQIAARLGDSTARSSVGSKCRRLGIPLKYSHKGLKVLHSDGKIVEKRNRQLKSTEVKQRMAAAHSVTTRHKKNLYELGISESALPPDAPAEQITIVDLTDRMCHWPLGDPLEDNFRFCGAILKDGNHSSYCRYHAAIAYVPRKLHSSMKATISVKESCSMNDVWVESEKYTLESAVKAHKERQRRMKEMAVPDDGILHPSGRKKQTNMHKAQAPDEIKLSPEDINLKHLADAYLSVFERASKEHPIDGASSPVPSPAHPSIGKIQRVVCDYFSVSQIDILSQRRTNEIMLPRHIAMYLARMLTLHSLPEIGRRFGDRDHTTVLHAIHKIEGRMASDPQFAERIDILTRLISGETFIGVAAE